MDTERVQQIDRVLRAALELEEPERRVFLDEACSGDAELRAEIESRLGLEVETRIGAVAASASPPSKTTAIGRDIGPYRIEALLGAGGMGEVYRARDERLGRAVAIKMVSASADVESMRRFTREARMASALNHPSIVTVYDLIEADGIPHLVTELVEGDVLRSRIAAGMRIDDAVDVARQVASALGAAHAAGVVHRDIKPENVIVRADGLVKVVDFGIAKLMESARGGGRSELDGNESEVRTAAGVMVGTVAYMSPEQARGQEVDGRTDVWSLGVMLYEMVTGQRPFRGASRMDVLVAVLNGEVEAVDGMPSELAEIVDRALRKRTEDRYATAGEMAAALERLKGRLSETSAREADGVATKDAAESTAENETQTAILRTAPTNLPAGSEPLIGRERELSEIVSELRKARLLTLTGPGGTGKTRLATEAGRALLPEFEHGVFFVELAAIRERALVASAVAQTLGVKEDAGASLDATLATYLEGLELLLVLDNFEQVLDAAPLVARLLAASPRLKVLATSRERLRVGGEHEIPLSPLELPPAGVTTTSAELGRYASVALFVERARAARRGFDLAALGETSVAAVAEICRRLDGLPLAIELAAARLRIMTPEALLARLDAQLKLLTGGAKELPERQQTMRAAIAWSYDLLESDERALFERLSIFSGGWTLDAAEGLDPNADVLDLLPQLADKSLVVVEDRGEDVRFRMLETVRQYAAERLQSSGDEAQARAAHAAWFAAFAEAALERERPDYRGWLEPLDREQENVRAALEWSAGAGAAPEITLRLCAVMGRVWSLRGRWIEGRSWLERALVGDAAPSAARASALFWLGRMARQQSDPRPARGRVTEALGLRRDLGDRSGVALALAELGLIDGLLGDFDAADTSLREALAIFEASRDLLGCADVISYLGRIAYDRKDFVGAEAEAARALEIHRELGNRRRVASQLYNVGVFAQRRGDHARATELLEESLTLAREFDERPLVARVTHFLGIVAGGQKDYGRAARLRSEAAQEYIAMGDRDMIEFLFSDVIGDALARGAPERAARLLGALLRLEETGAVAVRSASDTILAEHTASIRAALGETEAEHAIASGRTLTLEKALKLAFDDETRGL